MTRAALLRGIPLAVFAAVPALLILPVLLDGKVLYGHDVVSVFHCSRITIAEAFRSGRLPVWDPHVMGGFPLLAAVQGAVFYPPTWLCVLLPAGLFWTLSATMHLTLSGLFAQRWLERGLGVGPWSALAGGLLFMLSGYIVSHLYAGHVNYVWAYPWMAALLWRQERFLASPTLRRGVLLSVVLAMLFLAGVPQYVFFAGLVVLARGLHFVLAEREGRKERLQRWGKGMAWLFLGLLFCAPQLLPTLELVTQMHRGSADDRGLIDDHPLQPSDLQNLLLPPTPAAPGMSDPYLLERCGFLGGGAILLLFLAFAGKHRQRVLWAGLALTALLLALGTYTPLYPGFVALVPGAGSFRGPGRYLVVFTLGAVALASLGFDALWERRRVPFRIAAGLLALSASVQLIVFANDHVYPTDPRSLILSPEIQRTLKERVGMEGRVATTSAQDVGRCQAAGIDTVCGYEPMMLRRFAELMNAAEGVPIERSMVILASVGTHPVVDMLCTRVRLLQGRPLSPGLHDLARGQPVPRDVQHSLPRAWVVNNAVVLESREERLKILGRGPFDPRKTVILEEFPSEAPPVPTEEAAGRAQVVSRGPGRYVLEAEAAAASYLVLSEAYYPGWRAEIDGTPVPVLPANHLIQAVRLPAGKHVVTFAYRSRFLGPGFAVAVLAMLVPSGIVLVRRRRR